MKKFVGEEWIQQMLESTRAKQHPLRRFLQRDDNIAEAFLRNLDTNCNILLKGNEEKESLDRMRGKLRNVNGFFDTVPEIEWIVYFKKKGFLVEIEPSFHNKRPDFKTNLTGRSIYFEVTCVGKSPEEQDDNVIRAEIRKRMEKIPSRYGIILIYQKEFSKDDIMPVVKIIEAKILEFESKNITTPITTFYFSRNDYQDWYGYDGINLPGDIHLNPGKYPLYYSWKDSKAKIIFRPLKKKIDQAPIGFVFGPDIRN